MSTATASSLHIEGIQPLELPEVPALSLVSGSSKSARALEARQLFRRTLCVSLGLHVAGLGLGWLLLNTYFPPKAEVIVPPSQEVFDISIVPLSALETVLPKGAPVEAPAVAPEVPKKEAPPEPIKEKTQPPEVSIPKKKVESPKPTKQKPAPKTSSESSAATSAPAAVSSSQGATQPAGFVNGTAPSNEKARLNYQEAIALLLARAKRYPERALRRGVTGEATIRIQIRSDGSLADFEILRSAGASVLDEELRAMVDRAAPFPSFPGDLKRESLALVVPVAFTIK